MVDDNGSRAQAHAKRVGKLLRGRGGTALPPAVEYYAYELVDRQRAKQLTRRETIVLALLAVGFTPKEVRFIASLTPRKYEHDVYRAGKRIAANRTVLDDHYDRRAAYRKSMVRPVGEVTSTINPEYDGVDGADGNGSAEPSPA